MTLAGRLTLYFAAVAVAVSAGIGGLSYAATAHSLDNDTRSTLMEAAASLANGQVPDGVTSPDLAPDGDSDGDDMPRSSSSGAQPGTGSAGPPGPQAGDPAPAGSGGASGQARPDGHPPAGAGAPTMLLAQLLPLTGTPTGVAGLAARLPVGAADRRIAQASTDHETAFRQVQVGSARYLMLTRSRGRGEGAVQVARNLDDSTGVLDRLAGSVVVIALLVALAAAVAGRFAARALTRRLVRLTALAEQVSETGRVDLPVPTEGRDEVGRLGTAFDAMLGRLARSKDDQQRLVQNAGHELRTPLTSIRTNVSLLRRAAELSEDERAAILDDLTGETRELTDLVNELVELATDRRADELETTVDLAAVAGRVADRAQRRTARTVLVRADGYSTVRGRALGLERAVSNLVDNAIKFDSGGTEPVEIVVTGPRVEVRDRGPGVPAEDVDRIFDRFHRATSVRSLPGSGLGLSIVAEVATDHDGRVFATERDGGGAVIGFTVGRDRLQTGSNPG